VTPSVYRYEKIYRLVTGGLLLRIYGILESQVDPSYKWTQRKTCRSSCRFYQPTINMLRADVVALAHRTSLRANPTFSHDLLLLVILKFPFCPNRLNNRTPAAHLATLTQRLRGGSMFNCGTIVLLYLHGREYEAETTGWVLARSPPRGSMAHSRQAMFRNG